MIKESGLLKFLRFGVYLTAFVPLVIFKDFISPFHFGKIIVFRTLIEVLAVAYLVLILKNRSYLPRTDKIFWAFLFFTSAFTLTTVTSILPYPSFWGTLERMGGLWTFWHYFVFYIILTSVMVKREHWRRLLDFTIFAGILSAFYGFGQKTDIEFFVGGGGRARIFGTIGNAALFSGTQLLVAFLSLTLFLIPKNSQGRKTFYFLAFAIASIAVLMTAVRGSILAYGFGILTFLFLWGKYGKSSFGQKALKVLVGLIIIFVVFSFLGHGSDFVKRSGYLSRVTDLSLRSPTTETRFWAWEAGLKGWVESPKTVILGWGPENFNIPFSNNFNPKFFVGIGAETFFDRAHNMFIEILVTMGIVGFLAYVGIFVVLFKSLGRFLKENNLSTFGIGFIPLVVAYIIHNSFIFDTSANFIIFFTILGFVSRLENEQQLTTDDHQRENLKKSKTSLLNAIGVILFIAVAVLIYKTNILQTKANYATTRAIVRGWQSDFNGAIEKYKESLSYNVPGKYEYRHRLAQYLVGVGGPSIKEEKVRNIYLYTLEEVNKNVKENPNDYLPLLYGSRLNIILGQNDPASPYNDRALEYSLKALEISPTFIRTYFEIAQAYLNKKDHLKAIESFQKAVDLNPDAGVSHAYLGAAKIEIGDLSGADDLERALNSKNPHNPREVDFQKLINAYIKTKDFVRIAWAYEKLIKINPTQPEYYASLASAYFNLGRIDDAVAMARKTVKVDPSFEADARAFLKSIGREL